MSHIATDRLHVCSAFLAAEGLEVFRAPEILLCAWHILLPLERADPG